MKRYFYLLISCCVLCSSTYIEPDKKGRIFLTRDQGESWLQADSGFPEDASVNAMVLSGGNVIVATEQHGIYISDNELKSWKQSNKGLGSATMNVKPWRWPVNIKINSLAVHRNLLFAGSYLHGIFVSSDNGYSWEPSSEGLANLSIRCFLSTDTVLLAGTDNGVYESDDQGKTWKLRIQGAQVNSFAVLNKVLFAATNNGGLRSNDFGKNWTWTWNTRPLLNITSDGQNIYSIAPDRVFVTSDGANKWVHLDPHFSLYTFRITPSSTPLLISPWRNVFKSLRDNQPFRHDGLPEQSPFNEILVTPYGTLVAVSFSGC